MKNKKLQELLKMYPDDLEVGVCIPDTENGGWRWWYRDRMTVGEMIDKYNHQVIIRLLNE